MIQQLYRLLEQYAPTQLKELIPQRWRIWLGYQIKVVRDRGVTQVDGLSRPVVLPTGETVESVKQYLAQNYVKEDGENPERNNYLTEAFNRFVYTLELVPDGDGKLLELGASPYFITLLLKKYRRYELQFVNYFGDFYPERASQTIVQPDGTEWEVPFDNIDVETTRLPHPDSSFNAVLLCEVLEHFTNDPQHALAEIHRVLQPNGTLILSTPNVVRLENVARSLAGENFYDPYSGYGAHGRHNREYTVTELKKLLEHIGFTVDDMFTSDVYANRANQFMNVSNFKHLVKKRDDLGQYIFVRCRKTADGNSKKPAWLYRNYPAAVLG